MSANARHAAQLPRGWQRIGDSYRRADGFLLRALEPDPGYNADIVGAIVLYTLAPSDWFLIGESLGSIALTASAYAGSRQGLVGCGPHPNDFAYWMAQVDAAIPLVAL